MSPVLRMLPLCMLTAVHGFANNTLQWKPLYEAAVGGFVTSVRVLSANATHMCVYASGDMLSSAVAVIPNDAATATWVRPDGSMFLSYEMADFTLDPSSNTVYLASMSGVYVCESVCDTACIWSSSRTGMPAPSGSGYAAAMQQVLVNSSNPSTLLAFAGNKRNWGRNAGAGVVWRSTDRGASWTNLSTIAAGGNILTAACVPGTNCAGVWAAVSGYGVYRSSDGGKSWATASGGLPQGINLGYAAFHPDNASIAYAASCGYGGVYKTVNGGSDWLGISAGLPSDGCFAAFGLAPSDPDVLYTGSSSGGSVYKSVDGGASWAACGSAPGLEAYGLGFQSTFLDVHPTNSSVVFVATPVTIWVSYDGCATWSDATAAQPVPDASGTIWRGGGYSGLVTTNFKWNPFNPSMAVLQGMDAGKIWVSNDSMATWRRQTGLNEFGGGNDVAFTSSGRMYAGTGQYGWPAEFSTEGVVVSTDGGVTWSYCNRPNITGTYVVGSVYALPYNDSNVWAVYQDGHLYFSADGCATWQRLATPNDTLYNIAAPRKQACTDPSQAVLYVSGWAGVYNTTNGRDFVLMPGSPTAWTYSQNHVYLSQADETTLYAANGFWDQWHCALWRWSPASPGNGWENFLMGDTTLAWAADTPALSSTGRPCIIAVASNRNPYPEVCDAAGVRVSVDAGATWTLQSLGLGMRRVGVVAFSPDGKTLVAGLNGGGFMVADTSGLACEA